MANFDVKFLDSDDDLSLLTQEDNNGNINNVAIDDMEDLLNSSRDGAVGSLASVKCGDDSDTENGEVLPIAERYKPFVEDIRDGEEQV